MRKKRSIGWCLLFMLYFIIIYSPRANCGNLDSKGGTNISKKDTILDAIRNRKTNVEMASPLEKLTKVLLTDVIIPYLSGSSRSAIGCTNTHMYQLERDSLLLHLQVSGGQLQTKGGGVRGRLSEHLDNLRGGTGRKPKDISEKRVDGTLLSLNLMGLHLTNEDFEFINDHFPNLKKLNLSGAVMLGCPLAYLRSLSLTELDLSLCSIKEACISELKHQKFLKSLILSNSNVKDEQLESIQSLGIENLNLWGNRITDAGLSHLKLLPLKTLDLRGTRITDQGLSFLTGRPIRQLDIAGTLATDAGMVHIETMPLEDLNLSWTRITDAAFARLWSPSLLKMNVSNAKTSPEGRREFQRAKPNLKLAY
jgi:uncharacterized protein YjbI with pentapeptide repeats